MGWEGKVGVGERGKCGGYGMAGDKDISGRDSGVTGLEDVSGGERAGMLSRAKGCGAVDGLDGFGQDEVGRGSIMFEGMWATKESWTGDGAGNV